MKKYSIYSFLIAGALFFAMSCNTDKTKNDTASINQASITPTNTIVKAQKQSKSVATEGLDWYSMGDVEALVKSDKKKILVDVYTQWCGPCKMMDKNTFTNPEVQQAINEKYHAVKFDAEGPESYNFKGKDWSNPNHVPNKRGRNSRHELANFFNVRGYPTLVILDENFNILEKIVGYKTPEQLLSELKSK